MKRNIQNVAAFMLPITLMACVGGCGEDITFEQVDEGEETILYDTSFEIDEDGKINLASSVSRPYKEGNNYEK